VDPASRGRSHQRRQFCHSRRHHRCDRLATRHTARVTNEMGMFVRLSSLLTITVLALMCAHVVEIAVWTSYYAWEALKLNNATYFEFAFENYTALGYGDALPASGNRLIGPITALNGLLLVGWSIAVIFEVMRMAELSFGRSRTRGQLNRPRTPGGHREQER
jgi:Ion channel